MVNWTPGETIDEIERKVIEQALRHFENNKTHTANALGIAVRTIDNKLAKYADDDLAKKNGKRTLSPDHNAEMQMIADNAKKPPVEDLEPMPNIVKKEIERTNRARR